MSVSLKIPRRELLQLAETFKAGKSKIAGWYISEKLDGTRCFWDGGVSRGQKTKDVPWAGIIDPKTGDEKKKIKPIATGLWSRYGNPIMAPDWFLNKLPACPLDGELWAGREKFQLSRSICGGDEPDPRFGLIQYAVYSSPSLPAFCQTGDIQHQNMVCPMRQADIEKWLAKRLKKFEGFRSCPEGLNFDGELAFLREILADYDNIFLHQQFRLSEDEQEALAYMEQFQTRILDLRGEGCILRNPKAIWTPKRHRGLLKFKPYEDAEAKIIGFRAGKVGKQGNVLGKIGTLLVRTVSLKNTVEFEIGSGLTFDQRSFGDERVHSLGRRRELGHCQPW